MVRALVCYNKQGLGRADTVLRQRVIDEALSWTGTPYTHQASCKGAGCDCLGLIRGVYRAFWLEPETPPPYSPDWAEAGGRETLAEAAHRYLIPVPIAARTPGDVLLFRYKRGFPAKHAGILINPTQFLHAQHGGSVVLASLNSWWLRHIAFVFSFPSDGL
ncbi:putative phage cell wall peptidase, NlpC/P60 family [Cohaesibacter sp. ES.047]|uniref:NlpC/P60 family protein n=1 Tax=Cohaesibacter sp. ES.047 TaxID=1798205 RepID=UPI000BB74FB8|nr:NlpC/P60 family protein [Cohaesibacter sp. ES.047]SNY92807.1 putative phage cell wall peptidase, NlpC/P60 family [Cohaesibacter sp. ES.047]